MFKDVKSMKKIEEMKMSKKMSKKMITFWHHEFRSRPGHQWTSGAVAQPPTAPQTSALAALGQQANVANAQLTLETLFKAWRFHEISRA